MEKLLDLFWQLTDFTFLIKDDSMETDGVNVSLRIVSLIGFVLIALWMMSLFSDLAHGGQFAPVGIGLVLATTAAFWAIQLNYFDDLNTKPFALMMILCLCMAFISGVAWKKQVIPINNEETVSALQATGSV